MFGEAINAVWGWEMKAGVTNDRVEQEEKVKGTGAEVLED